MIRPLAAIAAFFLSGAVAAAQSDATVRGENPQTRKRLAEIEQNLRGGKANGAADELQKVLDDAGDDLVSADGKAYVPARRYVHRFLAQLPSDELKLYQDRVEAPAKALLAAGDAASLRTLLDRFYCARQGAEALLRLGDLQFEAGDVFTAGATWRHLTASPDAETVPHPNRPANPAAVLARLGLAAVYRGDRRTVSELLDLLRKQHAQDSGPLAGTVGAYAETLATLSAAVLKPRPPIAGDGTWTTFGGSPARSGRANGPLPPFLPMRPTWVTPLPRDPAAESSWGEPAKPPPIGAARSLAFHPVVVGETVYVADAGRIFAFDLRTGTPQPGFDARAADRAAFPPEALRIPSRVDADYTLSVSGGTLLARFGPPVLFGVTDAAARSHSALAGVAVAGQTVKWQQAVPAADGAPVAWEGAAVPAGNAAVAAVARSDGGRVVHSLAAFTADGRRRLWMTEVADAPSGPPGRARHDLVTVAGPLVVFCSHTGVVVAVNATTGKPAWAYRYDKVRAAAPRPRDLNPPAYADGRVYVAPNDADRVFAFDAATGRLLWQSAPVEVNQLVGVAAGKVVCTINGPIAGVKAFAADTGSTDAPDGWVQHDDPALATHGRGLLSDEFFYWPTAAGLFTLKLADGLPARQPNLGPHGNLAFAGGVLLVATPTELWGYVAKPAPESPAVPLFALVPKPPFGLVGVGPAAANTPAGAAKLPPLGKPPQLETLPTAAAPPRRTLPPIALPRPIAVSPVVATPDGLLARIGDQHLVRYDPTGNRVAWVLDGLSRPRFDPNAGWPSQAFLPHLAADGDRGVAFTAAARGLLLDTAAGTVRTDFAAPPPEHCGPAAFAAGVFAYPSGPGSVTARDRNTGAVRWKYPAAAKTERPASLAGTAPRVAAHGDFFVAVHRTFGVELDRIGPDRGTPRWPKPVLLPAFEFDPATLLLDGKAVVVPLPDRVLGLGPDTGRVLWDVPLAGGPFTAALAPNAAILLGTPTAKYNNDPFAAFVRNPHPFLLPGRFRAAYESWSDRTVRVAVIDTATGRTGAEFDLAADGPDAATTVTPTGLVVTAGTRTYRIH